MCHRPLAVPTLGDAFAMKQLQVLVPRVCMNARIQTCHYGALPFQRLQIDTLALAQHARDVVLCVPGMGLAQNRLGERSSLRAGGSAQVNQADQHGLDHIHDSDNALGSAIEHRQPLDSGKRLYEPQRVVNGGTSAGR